MKINRQLLKFPRVLPNDLEAFMVFYPKKYPSVVSYYEEVVPKVALDPKAYQEYGDWAKKELWLGFEKIKSDYEQGDKEDLAFLVDIDQRFNKLFCFRFWIVNYLFADGPLHDFFVDNLRNFIRKFIDVTEEIEDYEERVLQVQRDLLQSDYADLYLRQALSGVDLLRLLNNDPQIKPLLVKVTQLIDQKLEERVDEVNRLWDKVIKIIQSGHHSRLKEELAIPMEQVEMRGNMSPVYNMLTHSVEFREENEKLMVRQRMINERISGIFAQAKEKLTPEEYEAFDLSYKQARNLSMYKDVMGELDTVLLPLWFSLHEKVKTIICKKQKVVIPPGGHACMFYQIAWYLPTDLKDRVYSVDLTPFSLQTL